MPEVEDIFLLLTMAHTCNYFPVGQFDGNENLSEIDIEHHRELSVCLAAVGQRSPLGVLSIRRMASPDLPASVGPQTVHPASLIQGADSFWSKVGTINCCLMIPRPP